MSKKRLSPEDLEIWHKVTRTVKAYPGRKTAAPPKASAKPRKPAQIRPRPISEMPPPKHIAPDPAPLAKDKQTRRGRVKIDRKIDLHDMTYDQALGRLQQTIHMMRAGNKRVLLVVTGKGRAGEGLLRRSLPQWLARPDIRPHIARYSEAHIRHGGSGAFYVYLKRAERKFSPQC